MEYTQASFKFRDYSIHIAMFDAILLKLNISANSEIVAKSYCVFQVVVDFVFIRQ